MIELIDTLYISLPSNRAKSKRPLEIIANRLQYKEVRATAKKEVLKPPPVLIGSPSIIPAHRELSHVVL
jgi:hypothetical protein